MNAIKESDWKHLRQLKPVALDRFCSRIFSEIEAASSDQKNTSHERYLVVYELIQNQDRKLSLIFDDLKRSTAVGKIFLMRRQGLLTDAEWTGFSDEIRNQYEQISRLTSG